MTQALSSLSCENAIWRTASLYLKAALPTCRCQSQAGFCKGRDAKAGYAVCLPELGSLSSSLALLVLSSCFSAFRSL